MEVRKTIVANIHVGERKRVGMDEDTVAGLMESIKVVGLQSPISVIYRDDFEIDGELCDNVPVLVAGRHRLEALRRLKVVTTDVIVFRDDVLAELWEISENVHRAGLTVAERSKQVARWIELTNGRGGGADGVSGQLAQKLSSRGRKGEGAPERGISAAARELGVERTEARRAIQIARLPDEAFVLARELGLDDNQSALLKAAREPTAEAQTARLQEIADERGRKLRKQSEDDFATALVEHFPRHELPGLLSWLEGTNGKAVARAVRRLQASPEA